MRLNFEFMHDPESGREKLIVTDDRGHRMRGVRGAVIGYDCKGATKITLELVVNGRDVTLGRPVAEADRPLFVEN